jgi:hypothetical protein
MLALTTLVSATWVMLISKENRRAGLVVAATIFLIVIANIVGEKTGYFSRLDIVPPVFLVMNAVILLLIFLFGMGCIGKVGNHLVENLPVKRLVALQIFRLPLEMLMLRAASLQIMPLEFSLLGYNWDALTGLGALLLTVYMVWTVSVPRRLVWFWNVMGLLMLLAIAALAVLTSPVVQAFGADPGHINSWVLFFPYSLLPSILVSFAVLGHVILTRKLINMR